MDAARGWIPLALAAALLAGCASAPPEREPPVDLASAFSRSGSAQVPERWWRAFGDERLNDQVATALRGNLDLRSTWERLEAARAVLDRESAGLFPSLEGSAQARERDPEPRGDETLRLGLSAEYEVDLWGRIRAGVEAERRRARALRADYRAAALSLAAEVTRGWYRLAEARARLALLERQIETNAAQLRLVRVQVANGQARRADTLRQRQLLEVTRERRYAVQAQIRTLEHQLAVLLGRPPQEGLDAEALPAALPALPALPETGLPAELVQRRPDVRAAFHRLQAADRDVAAAVSRQFPRLTLTAEAAASDEGASALYEDWARTLTAGLVAPLFDAGERRAQVEEARAVERQRLAEYGQAVLTAFQEVEDALIQERKQGEQVRSLRRQVADAAQAHEALQRQHRNGTASYLDVLSARTQEQQLRRDLLAAQLQRLESRIALYRALAGGFATEREAAS